jgi:hypothetical protein
MTRGYGFKWFMCFITILSKISLGKCIYVVEEFQKLLSNGMMHVKCQAQVSPKAGVINEWRQLFHVLRRNNKLGDKCKDLWPTGYERGQRVKCHGVRCPSLVEFGVRCPSLILGWDVHLWLTLVWDARL